MHSAAPSTVDGACLYNYCHKNFRRALGKEFKKNNYQKGSVQAV
jgi:hypothetical protein